MDSSTGDKNPGYTSERGHSLTQRTAWWAESVRNLPQVSVTATGEADGGQHAAPGGDAAFLLAGSRRTNPRWVILQTTTVEACESVGKVPANPLVRYLRIRW